MVCWGSGLAVEKRQVAAVALLSAVWAPPSRGRRGARPGRVSRVWNTETVRHEALHNRAEMKGLRRRVVAATRLELRAA